jgi:hypothetical protein
VKENLLQESKIPILDVNFLTELSTVGRTGNLNVAGTTTGPATNVTVNSLAAERYADNTFARTNISLVDGLKFRLSDWYFLNHEGIMDEERPETKVDGFAG